MKEYEYKHFCTMCGVGISEKQFFKYSSVCYHCYIAYLKG